MSRITQRRVEGTAPIRGNVHNMTRGARQAWRERWPNFAPSELASWGGEIMIDPAALDGLQKVRFYFGQPMHVTSAYRSPAHNAYVGGSKRSQHLKGRAFDVAIREAHHGDQLERLALQFGARGIGRYHTFIHLDWRSEADHPGPDPAYWDRRK